MRRKYAPPIQHTIYKDGYKQALHDFGDALEKRIDKVEDNESSRKYVFLEDVERELGKLTEGLRS